jgi:HPt (histidine-containing phosphotransfer) domain-containing protein
MAAFDPRVLLDEYGDDALVRDLARLLIESVPVQADAVRSAVAVRDSAALRAAAHKLRGSIAPFGVPAAVEAARTLEAMGATGNLDGAETLSRELVADVQSLRDSAKDWLEAHRTKTPDS